MRLLRTCRIALAAACSVTGAMSAVQAVSYPVDTLNFPSDQLAFPTNGLNFPSDTLSFPSEPVRTETATTIEVTLPADILFDFDKAEIHPTAKSALHEVAQLLRERAHGPGTIQGYTDALGTDSYNQRLSDRRIAVKIWLRTNEGLADVAFTTIGFGARNPVAPNLSRMGWTIPRVASTIAA
jgi:outer membrane protein OmpA-like peptidoglycan-associated protein